MEYHHFPLSFHKMAESSAVASVAAQRQGKFFEMVDKLYSDTKKQDAATVRGYAKDLGLDLEQFDKDIKDPAILRDVRMDAEAGKKIGVSGTPSMYLNGKKISARTPEEMSKLVTEEIAAVDKLMESGKDVKTAVRQRVLANSSSAFLDYVVDRTPLEVDLSPPKPPAPPKPTPVDTNVYNAQVFPGDPVKGPLNAAVTIVECTDFQ